MQDAIVDQLLALNRRFYQTFAEQFAETRGRLQPGVSSTLADFPPEATILDLGCGIGEVANELFRRGHEGYYLGIDFSTTLISIARGRCEHPSAHFQQSDFADPSWVGKLLKFSQLHRVATFDRVLAFATLHHLPSNALRSRVLTQVRDLLAEGGHFVHSNWNFMASPRLQARIVPWSEVDLDESDVEMGDYLLDWRRGGYGLRYVHHFSEGELQELAASTSFQVVKTFYSDGEGGRLGLYQVWEKIA
ncbi:MAG TPA: class I SAM-dependent methyltransferase [Anaerolineae bacterium]|nr:class I SAM-dependent methyltransferase [Anaerolineae bacterium]